MLLFQGEPHFFLPFSVTHMNLHLGNMIRDIDYKASKTIAKYMKNNVNHKLIPIQGDALDLAKSSNNYTLTHITPLHDWQ